MEFVCCRDDYKWQGGEVKRKRLVKWQFYAVAAEEFMTYLDEDETSAAFSEMQGIVTDHQPRPIPKDFAKNIHIVLSVRWKDSLGIRCLLQ